MKKHLQSFFYVLSNHVLVGFENIDMFEHFPVWLQHITALENTNNGVPILTFMFLQFIYFFDFVFFLPCDTRTRTQIDDHEIYVARSFVMRQLKRRTTTSSQTLKNLMPFTQTLHTKRRYNARPLVGLIRARSWTQGRQHSDAAATALKRIRSDRVTSRIQVVVSWLILMEQQQHQRGTNQSDKQLTNQPASRRISTTSMSMITNSHKHSVTTNIDNNWNFIHPEKCEDIAVVRSECSGSVGLGQIRVVIDWRITSEAPPLRRNLNGTSLVSWYVERPILSGNSLLCSFYIASLWVRSCHFWVCFRSIFFAARANTTQWNGMASSLPLLLVCLFFMIRFQNTCDWGNTRTETSHSHTSSHLFQTDGRCAISQNANVQVFRGSKKI